MKTEQFQALVIGQLARLTRELVAIKRDHFRMREANERRVRLMDAMLLETRKRNRALKKLVDAVGPDDDSVDWWKRGDRPPC